MEQIQKTAQTMRNICITKTNADPGKLRKFFVLSLLFSIIYISCLHYHSHDTHTYAHFAVNIKANNVVLIFVLYY